MTNRSKKIEIDKEFVIIAHFRKKIRIDKYLASLGRKELYSRSYIDKLLKNGFITIEEKVVKKSEILSGNEKIKIKIPYPVEKDIVPEKIALDIVHEDDDLAIINKPAGMVVHPAPGHYTGTLANALVYHFGQLSKMTNPLRPGIVHRLDKDTSGLLIIAKNDYVHSLLKKMFENHKIKKTYLAFTMGNLSEQSKTIKTHFGRNPKNRQKMAVLDEGKIAITHYEVEQSFPGFDLTKIFLETGRTHQIRVHFAHIHHPVMGDKTYSTKKQMINLVPFSTKDKMKNILSSVLKRQALHAHQLEFIHPISNQNLTISNDIPDDMKNVISAFDSIINEE